MSKKLTKGNQGLIGAVGRAYASEGNLMTPKGAASLGEGIEKLAEGYATGIKKVKDAVVGSVTGGTLPDPKDEIKVDPSKGGQSLWNPPSKPKFDINSPSGMSPLPKKSAFKYNASLVNAVAKAYGSEGNLVTPEALGGLTKPIFSTINDLSKKSSEHAAKMIALNKSKGADYSGTNPKVLQNIIDIQTETDTLLKESKGIKGVFTGQGKKAENLQKVTSNEAAIKTLVETNEHIEMLIEDGNNNWGNMSNAVNKENAMTYNAIASGKIWDVLEYEGNGIYTIENPMGEGRIDIREFDIVPTIDPDYEENEAKGLKSMKTLYKRGDYTTEELEKEASRIVTSLNRTNPDSKFDDPDFDEFVQKTYSEGGELDYRMFEENISEYVEANTFFGDEDEPQDKIDLYANTLKHMNIDEEWIEFKANKYMQSVRDLEAKREQDANNNDPSKALSWEKQQAATKDFKLNALTTLEGGADFVEWSGGMVLKKGPDGKYYEIGNQSKKIDIEGMDGYSIASIRAALRK